MKTICSFFVALTVNSCGPRDDLGVNPKEEGSTPSNARQETTPLSALPRPRLGFVEDAETDRAEISELTEDFWKGIVSKDFTDAATKLFAEEDDPTIPQAVALARHAKHAFRKLLDLAEAAPDAVRTKSIAVDGFLMRYERKVGIVTITASGLEGEDYETLTIFWLRTSQSGWRLIEL